MGTSLYYDPNVADPTYFDPIISPVVQPGGATVDLEYAGSLDGVIDDVGFTPDIRALNGLRFVRFQANLGSNVFTGARARINILDLPFTPD